VAVSFSSHRRAFRRNITPHTYGRQSKERRASRRRTELIAKRGFIPRAVKTGSRPCALPKGKPGKEWRFSIACIQPPLRCNDPSRQVTCHRWAIGNRHSLELPLADPSSIARGISRSANDHPVTQTLQKRAASRRRQPNQKAEVGKSSVSSEISRAEAVRSWVAWTRQVDKTCCAPPPPPTLVSDGTEPVPTSALLREHQVMLVRLELR